eukprot:3326222-Rhodomonas_salina.4
MTIQKTSYIDSYALPGYPGTPCFPLNVCRALVDTLTAFHAHSQLSSPDAAQLAPGQSVCFARRDVPACEKTGRAQETNPPLNSWHRFDLQRGTIQVAVLGVPKVRQYGPGESLSA